MKRVLSLILFVLWVVTAFPAVSFTVYAAERQSEEPSLPEDAIAIESVADLEMICNEYPADGYYYLTCDLDMTDDVSEYGDYYNDGAGWLPIGTSSVPFTGTFNGRGFTVTGLWQSSTGNYTGLFGYAKDAVITNLTVESAMVKGASYAGIILGYGSGCSLDTCTVSDFQLSASQYAGAVIGYGTNSSVSDCSADDGSVTASSSYAGGVIGYLTSPADDITNCTNAADISASAYTGGIVGYVNGTIANCSNTGSVTSRGSCTGGIAGSASTVLDCVNNGSVSAKATGVSSTGGVVGSATTVTDCVNTGSVVGTLYGSTNMTSLSTSYIGGVAGRATTLSRCCNLGEVKGNGGTYYYEQYHYRPTGGYVTTATARCYVYACGIQGSGDASLSACYNAGTLTGNSYSYKYGLTYSGTVSDCYNFGPNAPLSYSAAATNCYNTNGIISTNGTAENCYYYAASASGVGTLLTLRQLRIESFFENWDFEATWTMEGNEDYLYPELQALTPDYEKTLAEISIAALPDQVEYYDGDALNLTGARLRLTYDNETTEKIDITNDMIIGFDNSISGEQDVTVSYEGFTTTFPVTVIMREVVSIEIATAPAKLTYLVNETSFDASGGTLNVSYNNGSTAIVPIEASMCEGFDSSRPGVNTLTVSYQGKTITMDIRIVYPYEIHVVNDETYQIVVNGEPIDAFLLIAIYNDQQQLSSCSVISLDMATDSLCGTLPSENCALFLVDTTYTPLCRH